METEDSNPRPSTGSDDNQHTTEGPRSTGEKDGTAVHTFLRQVIDVVTKRCLLTDEEKIVAPRDRVDPGDFARLIIMRDYCTDCTLYEEMHEMFTDKSAMRGRQGPLSAIFRLAESFRPYAPRMSFDSLLNHCNFVYNDVCYHMSNSEWVDQDNKISVENMAPLFSLFTFLTHVTDSLHETVGG